MIRLPRACRGRTEVRLPANSSHMCCVELALKGLASAGKGLARSLTDYYAVLMSPSMHEMWARPWVGVRVPLASMYW